VNIFAKLFGLITKPEFQSPIVSLATFFLSLYVGFFVGSDLLSNLVIAFGFNLPFWALFFVFDYSPQFASWLIARRSRVVVSLFCLFLVFGVTLHFLNLNFLESGVVKWESKEIHITAGFFILGIVLGSIIRQILGRVVFESLLGHGTTGLRILGLAVWGTTFIMVPYPEHPYAVPWYIIGFGLGMAIHKWFHLTVEKHAKLRRRLLNIWTSPEKTDTELS